MKVCVVFSGLKNSNEIRGNSIYAVNNYPIKEMDFTKITREIREKAKAEKIVIENIIPLS